MSGFLLSGLCEFLGHQCSSQHFVLQCVTEWAGLERRKKKMPRTKQNNPKNLKGKRVRWGSCVTKHVVYSLHPPKQVSVVHLQQPLFPVQGHDGFWVYPGNSGANPCFVVKHYKHQDFSTLIHTKRAIWSFFSKLKVCVMPRVMGQAADPLPPWMWQSGN